jgi:hypothetical protein
MAMQRKLWNANELSVEFGMTYRTTHARLANVKPAEIRGKQRLYRLSDAASAILGYRSNPEHKPVEAGNGIAERAGGPFSLTGNLVDEAIATVLVMLAGRLPAEVGCTAIRAGVPVELAQELFKGFGIRACAMVDEIAAEVGVTWASDDHFDLPQPPDWEAVTS